MQSKLFVNINAKEKAAKTGKPKQARKTGKACKVKPKQTMQGNASPEKAIFPYDPQRKTGKTL